jgi:predicted nucleic acid-binding protein
MAAVSNTSPLLNLAIIERLGLVQEQFSTVLIPQAVLDETKMDTNLPGAETIRLALQKGWLRVAEVKDTHLVQALALELDLGEAAAIALALDLGSLPILMDEHDGRAKAKALGLEPIGALGILLRAKRQGQLESIQDAMQALRQEAGFFIADELFEAVLTEAGEGAPTDSSHSNPGHPPLKEQD